jgi:hypothetical protein
VDGRERFFHVAGRAFVVGRRGNRKQHNKRIAEWRGLFAFVLFILLGEYIAFVHGQQHK